MLMEEHPLLIIHDKTTGKQWERQLTEDSLVIGREKACELCLPDRQISRQHATIYRQDDRFFLRDMGSRNGTFLNDVIVTAARPLQDGDEIRVAARYQLIFVASEATAPLYRLGPSPQGIYLDRASHSLWVNGVEVAPALSGAQYRLMEFLYDRIGTICTREEIAQAVWPEEIVEGITDQAIDALIRRLRRRLASTGSTHSFIETLRGHGFRLNPP